MARRLPTALQIQKIEAQCLKFNDNCDEIDFLSEVDKTLSLSENRSNIQDNFPHFVWEDPDPEVPARFYEEELISSLQEEADPYSYTILKKYKLEGLERDSRRAERLSKKLKTYRKPSTPGTCRIKKVEVRSHKRCLPRR